ncbi:hypothetical protein NONI108955_23355 [Nocardia ninae]|uniref:Uncharacterized protein n=1 Tax=Nocardia ninae NBRC 108245 TaxID=1210091 RepID=A0A511MQV3_9NOCA|nr:hypothetical protein [Nocardia ninae]GEM42972.1 hypothetical protein NN4_74910 [Nocardia ninae NBRC 108245]
MGQTGLSVIIALALLLAWALYPGLARFLAILLVIDSIASVFLFPYKAPLAHLGWLIFGIALWLASHRRLAIRHRSWRSTLAKRAFQLPGLRHLQPRALP